MKTFSPKKRWGFLKRILWLIFLVALVATSGLFCYQIQRGNFHVVKEDKVYRSGQLTALQLEEYVGAYGIRSVLNLRGKNESADWWQEEVSVCRNLGLYHYDLPLSSKREPTQEEIIQLLNILREAPKPLLIHCEGGADRTGFASALYLYFFEDYPYQKAKRQLSFLYGHAPFFRRWTRSMDTALERFCLTYQ